MWALLLISKVLVLYASCEPSEAARVETALVRAFRQAAEHLEAHPLFDWGKYRWFEGLIAVNWLYQRTGGEWLLDFADLLHAQGRDYVSLIDREFSPCICWKRSCSITECPADTLQAMNVWPGVHPFRGRSFAAL